MCEDSVNSHIQGDFFIWCNEAITTWLCSRLTSSTNKKSNPLNLQVQLSIPYTSEPEAVQCVITHILTENEEAAPHRPVSHLVWQSTFKLVLCHLLVSMNQNVVLGIYCPWVSSALQTSWCTMTNIRTQPPIPLPQLHTMEAGPGAPPPCHWISELYETSRVTVLTKW